LKTNRLFHRLLALALLLMISLTYAPGATAADTAETAQEAPGSSGKLVYVIPIHQTIETGLQKFLERAFKEAEEARAEFIVLDINTLGGRIDAAMDIGDLIQHSPIHTIAFIHGKAISAGSYISLSADQIVMAPGSSIGAAAVVDLAGNKVQDAKILSVWLAEMRAAASHSGRNPAYAEGMVDENMVVEVKEIGRTFGKGELISFSHDEALKAGYAEFVTNKTSEVLEFIGAQEHQVINIDLTPAEKFARFLTNPIVMTILLLLGLAGVAIEIFVPGFGIPGIVGISSFGLYFFGHYVAGFAGTEDIFLFIIGVILLVIEIFVPSFGIFGILGILSLFGGVVLAAYDTERAMLSLGIATVIAIIVVALIVKYFKHRGVWNRFILKDEMKTEHGYVSAADRKHLLGKTGQSVTPLRPSGTAMIDDIRVDVVTGGDFIASGKKIKVIQVEGNRVVVREIKEDENNS
jgi:membrane-bound serine protease (ClpP class)